MRNTTGYLCGALLLSGLVLAGIAAYVAAYVTMAAMLIGLTRGNAGFPRQILPVYGIVVFGYALIVASLPFVYRSPVDLMAPLALLPLLLMPGVERLLGSAPRQFTAVTFASLCLAGAALGVAAGIAEMLILHPTRVGVWNNPIHFASLTMLLGFMALVGIPENPSRLRLLYLGGPLLGMGAALLSGSRGPVFAAGLMGLASIPFLLLWAPRDRRPLAIVAAGMIALIVALSALGRSRAASVLEAIASIWQNGLAGAGDVIRSAMYQSAQQAFQQSPVFGHGYGQIMSAAIAVASPEQQELMAGYDTLHSDIANFAVLAGSLGLLAYAAFIIAPLALLRANPPAVRLGATILSSGFFALGLTNGMFGLLPQTVLYAMLLGCLCALASARPTARANIAASLTEEEVSNG